MNHCDRPRARQTVLVVTALLALSAGCADGGAGPATPAVGTDRQAEVARRGASVMPFDLDRTTHHFQKTDSGGVQTVDADDPRDTTQIGPIQRHLRDEADRFRRGDFSDPASIHGDQMPGLAALRGSAGRITVDFEMTSGGARITYTTSEAALVAALHAWFDAQVSDHGQHATPR